MLAGFGACPDSSPAPAMLLGLAADRAVRSALRLACRHPSPWHTSVSVDDRRRCWTPLPLPSMAWTRGGEPTPRPIASTAAFELFWGRQFHLSRLGCGPGAATCLLGFWAGGPSAWLSDAVWTLARAGAATRSGGLITRPSLGLGAVGKVASANRDVGKGWAGGEKHGSVGLVGP